MIDRKKAGQLTQKWDNNIVNLKSENEITSKPTPYSIHQPHSFPPRKLKKKSLNHSLYPFPT